MKNLLFTSMNTKENHVKNDEFKENLKRN